MSVRVRQGLLDAALLLGAVLVLWLPSGRGTLGPYVPAWLPPGLLALSALVAFRINQVRVGLGMLLLALDITLVTRGRAELLALFLPISCLALRPLVEPRLLSFRMLTLSLVALAPSTASVFLNPSPPIVKAALVHRVTLPFFGIQAPAVAFAAALLLLLTAPLVRDRQKRWIQVLSTVCLLGAWLFLMIPDARNRLPQRFSFLAVVMLIGLFRLYWQRVYLDELTQVPNRRALEELLSGLGRRFTVAMIDIDFFKSFNDRFGHQQGDDVLRYVARHFEKRTGGRVFRYGGEEFCLVFAGTGDAQKVFPEVDALRESLAQRAFFLRSAPSIRRTRGKKARGKTGPSRKRKLSVTVSIGLASRGRHKSPDEVLAAADQALYRAKRTGRNRVLVAPSRAQQ